MRSIDNASGDIPDVSRDGLPPIVYWTRDGASYGYSGVILGSDEEYLKDKLLKELEKQES